MSNMKNPSSSPDEKPALKRRNSNSGEPPDRKSQLKIAIFDFDDTIFPTSLLKSKNFENSDFLEERKHWPGYDRAKEAWKVRRYLGRLDGNRIWVDGDIDE